MSGAALYFEPVRQDWAKLLRELEAAGCSPYKVARALGIDHPTVYGWLREGKEPRHSYGEALRAMHRAVCGSSQ